MLSRIDHEHHPAADVNSRDISGPVCRRNSCTLLPTDFEISIPLARRFNWTSILKRAFRRAGHQPVAEFLRLNDDDLSFM